MHGKRGFAAHLPAKYNRVRFCTPCQFTDKDQAEAEREQAEEEWRSREAERDAQTEDLQARLGEAERAREATEEKLKEVRLPSMTRWKSVALGDQTPGVRRLSTVD